MHICLGHLTALFGFLSTPSQNWRAECSQCLNDFEQAKTSLSSPHSLQLKYNRKCNKINKTKERERERQRWQEGNEDFKHLATVTSKGRQTARSQSLVKLYNKNTH